MTVLTNEQAIKKLQDKLDQFWKLDKKGFVMDFTTAEAIKMGIEALKQIGIIEDKIANDLTSKDTKASLEDVKAKISRHKITSIQDYIQKSIGELATKKDLTMAQAVVSYSQILMTIYRMEINNDIQNNRNTNADTDLV